MRPDWPHFSRLGESFVTFVIPSTRNAAKMAVFFMVGHSPNPNTKNAANPGRIFRVWVLLCSLCHCKHEKHGRNGRVFRILPVPLTSSYPNMKNVAELLTFFVFGWQWHLPASPI